MKMKLGNNTTIELLAPAKNLECGIAALNCGADAVYVGAPKFSARKAVGNSLQDIEELVKKAHKYWARVYVALNTILFDNELEEAQKIIRSVYEVGVDGLIIQDFAILKLDIPPIPLIASTQMHNYELEHIQFLERTGFKRVILARELSLAKIHTIRKYTNIELECFVHGSLCVSFSGRCYLSFATQRRSANRGECAQPCRLPYTLKASDGQVIADTQYLLSLKDLNLSQHLEALLDAGITSFKIEGRLKDVEYVKNVTAFYRKRLDEILNNKNEYTKASSGTAKLSFEPNLSKTFNRGYTSYFLHTRQEDIVSLYSPKSIGVLLGKVVKINGSVIVIDTKEVLTAGDGICYFSNDNVLYGTRIQKISQQGIEIAEIGSIQLGTEIYRNYDKSFWQQLSVNHDKRKIAVFLFFEERNGSYLLKAIDEDGVIVENIIKVQQIAQQPQRALKILHEQLTKSGNSIFEIKSIDIKIQTVPFFQIKTINEARRNVLNKLESERCTVFKMKNKHSNTIKPATYSVQMLDYSYNVSNKLAKQFYKECGVKEIENALELEGRCENKVVMTTKHCLRYYFNLCHRKKEKNTPLILEDFSFQYRLEFDCNRCCMEIYFLGKK